MTAAARPKIPLLLLVTIAAGLGALVLVALGHSAAERNLILLCLLLPVAARAGLRLGGSGTGLVVLGAASVAALGWLVWTMPAARAGFTPAFWLLVLGAWTLGWQTCAALSAARPRGLALQRLVGVAVPLLFGAWLLLFWELACRGFAIPQVLLPAPSQVWARILSDWPTLLADFRQTFLQSVLIGYAIGCGSGFLAALAIDRVPFLKRGLLPVGNLVSALPIVGVAPIMVMWFGFDWPSKAAVVVIMTFFPMLVNTIAGLDAAGRMERDLMRTYAASHGQALTKLRLPAAMPFVFNALKINSTLALIGAIVAEFFGTPTVGMGFRISTEVGRMAIDMVWAEIAVAALAGSLFYGFVSLVERLVTFWHPSFRAR
ncbi:ABC transporter permease [Methylobrevis albus]|uniref:ABC transporter permease subunit n=1 Tax=Methylobrevis albus TaxID=2793297 RepID=A0A931MY23_9HYPH|nr:ABC transporter permease [Methylobrevis albus]MBH0237565.1 ABC transporter permease subunit [Methylobrevis albus]